MGFSKNIAVVGAGVSGLVSAYLLDRDYEVSLFEAGDYFGGHTNTVSVCDPELGDIGIDTGFIVHNRENYPLLCRLFEALEVPTQDSDMSFGAYFPRENFFYGSDFPWGVFAQKRRVLSPQYWRFLREIGRFNRTGLLDLESGNIGGVSLGEYVETRGFDSFFVAHYLLPMGASIWSCSVDGMLGFPAESFLAFFRNHSLLQVRGQHRWRTVSGGSKTYVDAILKQFSGVAKSNSPVIGVERDIEGVNLAFQNGDEARFDAVVLATHADTALKMLRDETSLERELLGAWAYSSNEAILHTDISVLPSQKSAWMSWNFKDLGRESGCAVSYYMNRLQKIESSVDYFVSLNMADEIEPEHVIRNIQYTHPIFSQDAIQSQARLSELNEGGPVYFCGSYFGYGFHEDGMRSGVDVARRLGVVF